MRIKHSDLSNTSKFLSKYLNSVAAFLGQVPLNGTGTIAIKEKYQKKKKKWVNLLVWISLQDRARLIISLPIDANRIKYL